MFRKNTASQFIHFQGVDASTGGIKAGVTWTVRRCIDGTFAAGGGTVTEDGSTGWYKYAMSQADTNGNNIGFNFSGTGAVPQTVNIITTACDPTTATNFGITALPATAVTTNASLLTSGTGTDQLSVSAGKVLLQATQSGVTIPTVTTVTNQLTAAAIATGVWQDSTSGDFTVASSIGKALYIANVAPGGSGGHLISGSNSGTTTLGALTVSGATTLAALSMTTLTASGAVAFQSTFAVTGTTTLTGAVSATNASNDIRGILLQATQSGVTIPTVTTVTNQLTAAQIATGVWTDTTAGDFTTALSIGKSIMNGVSLGTGLTINAYTGNTVQTGDSFARIGLAGVGLTNLGDTRIANLDAAVSSRSTLTQTQVTGGAYSIQSASCVLGDTRVANLDAAVTTRMATYTQPTGFLAATFPTTVASTTNITSASGVSLTSSYDFAKGTVAMTESYAADGAAPTPAQALFAIQQFQQEKAISSTTMLVKKLDGSTTAMTFTLDSATSPTTVTRSG